MQFVNTPYLNNQPTSQQYPAAGYQYPPTMDPHHQQQQQQQHQPRPQHALGYPVAQEGQVSYGQPYAPPLPAVQTPTTLNYQHASTTGGGPFVKAKRKQVKNACVNCQKACKKCDDARPCPRCVRYGIAGTCVNSVRKERKKGVKRGPYKQRKGQDSASTSEPGTPVPGQAAAPGTTAPPATGMLNHANPYLGYAYPHHPAMLSYMQHPMYASYAQQQQQQQHQVQQQQQQTAPGAAAAGKEEATDKSKATGKEAGNDSVTEEKLNVLSQLCSAVLDHSDTPKAATAREGGDQQPSKQLPTATTTAPDSSSNNNNSNSSSSGSSHTSTATPTSHGMPHPNLVYHNQIYNQQQTMPGQQPPTWPLPSLQSVVHQPADRLYYQQQQQQPQQQGSPHAQQPQQPQQHQQQQQQQHQQQSSSSSQPPHPQHNPTHQWNTTNSQW
ncbi:hypothetical protein BCR43DRAFT_497405 [Syncephalastrum racemosum]|uniref:Zn(2)-C6 fungal-type domain-containing protein n=1 Tax=Syncephalastrum racemosum TaxID=13706 RepID=A0A1X2H238_SYNRA|nr:hypothetical protein BCR43DRAFT_497405 [Syncephalastrum racemosum]